MKMKFMILASVLLSAGCATPVPVTTYPQADIGEAEGAEKNDSGFRVIVTDIKSSHGSSSAPDLSKAAVGEISRIIQESGATQVNIDRGLRKRLDTEFQLYEANGESDYVSPKAANLAVTGTISSATITPAYVQEPRHYDADAGKMVVGPPECRYTTRIQGSLELYSVNPVEKTYQTALNGTEVITAPAAGRACRDLSKNMTDSLYQKALHKAMNDAAADVKNKMASSGYVKLARRDPKTNKMYYRLSIKPSAGALPGVGVEFIETEEIDGQKEKIPFATGKIVCTNRPENSYAALETAGAESRIQKGTPVKLKFPDSGLLYMVQKSLEDQGVDMDKVLPMLGCNP